MVVLLDLEWIEKNEIHLTQLSTLRVDTDWAPLDYQNFLVCPGDDCLKNPSHMAFGGYDMSLFKSGVSEEHAIKSLNEWLLHEDEIWVWSKSDLRVLGDLWVRWLSGIRFPSAYSMAAQTRKKALQNKYDAVSPSTILASLKEPPLLPENRSSIAVEALRVIFQRLDIERNVPAPVSVLPTQRERNLQAIRKSEFRYLFLKNSEVFHLKTCRACLNAKHTGTILGSVYYETAAKGRRPCKLCNPEPPNDQNDKVIGPESACPESESDEMREFGKEIVRMKLLTGEVIQIKRRNVIGWCHHTLHKGAVNRSILKKHNCLEKNCPYLERNNYSTFWTAREQEAAAEEKQRIQKRKSKAAEQARKQYLLNLAADWQAELDKINSDMFIVRVELESSRRYKVFYVSDNPFADGNRFPDFIDIVKNRCPGFTVYLRHIRDVDGHFVTRDEYFMRCKRSMVRVSHG